MTAYTIHEPGNTPSDPIERADAVRFVKEGTAWWALIAPLIWLLYHRMWIVFAGYVAVLAAVPLLFGAAGLGDRAAGWCTIAISAVFAMFANDLRRWTLTRSGYVTSGAVSGRNLIDAELKYFSRWPEAASPPPSRLPARRKADGEDDVIGLFPDEDR